MTSSYHSKEKLRLPSRQALAGALITLVLLLPIWAVVVTSYQDSLRTDRHSQVMAILTGQTAALHVTLNQRLSLLNGLQAFVQTHHDDLSVEADAFLGSLSASLSGIRRLTLAPTGAPPLVYPAGSVPGPDESTAPDAIPGDAPDGGDVVLDGPYQTAEGPVLVGRQGVFLAGEPWGTVAITLDWPVLLAEAGLAGGSENLSTVLVDADGQVLFGDRAALDADPARSTVWLPTGEWTLAAAPVDGWNLDASAGIVPVTGLLVVLLVSALAMAILDSNARLRHLVTARTRDLQSSETRFRTAFNHARVGMALLDLDGRFIQVNNRLATMLGRSETALLGTPLADVMQPDDRITLDNLRRRLLDAGHTHVIAELHAQHTDGSILITQVSLGLVRREDAPPLIILQMEDYTQQKMVEDTLWEQILRNELILQSASDGFCVVDEDGRILESNAAFAAITGYSQLALLDMDLSAIVTPTGEPCLAARLPEAREHQAIRFEATCQHPGGEPYDLSASITLVDLGQSHVYFISLQNVTERVQSEVELRKLSRAVQQSPASVVITDTNGHIEYVNPQFTRVSGYSLEEVLGQTPRILKSGHTPPETYQELWDTISSGGHWQGEFLNRKKSGEAFWEFASISGVKDHQGRITHYIAVKEDITARKEVEAALLQSQQRLANVIDSAPVVLFALDANGVFTLSEGRGLVNLHLQPGEVIGQSALDVYRDHPEVLASVHRALAGETFTAPVHVNDLVFEIHYTPLRDDAGELTGVSGVAVDVTGRQQAERDLRDSEARFRMITEHSLSGIFIIQDGSFAYVNPAFANIFQYEPEELIHSIGPELIHPDDQDLVRTMFIRRAQQESTPIFSAFRGVRRDGEVIHCEILGSNFQYQGRLAILGTLLDVTERRKAEVALLESEYRFRTTADNIQHGLTILENQQVIYANDRVLEIFGLTMDEYRTMPRLKQVAPEDIDRVRAVMLNVSMDNPPPPELEFWIVRPDGERRFVHNRYSVDWRDENHAQWIIVTTDMTNRHQAEQALRESEARYRGLFEDVPIPLLEEDMSLVKAHLDALKAQGVNDFCAHFTENPADVRHCARLIRLIDANRATLQLYKVNNVEELDQHLTSLVDSKSITVDSFAQELATLLGGRTQYSSETVIEAKGGELRYISLRSSLAPGHEKTWTRVFVSLHDITALKDAEDAEHAQRTLAESLRDTAAALTSTLDQDMVLRRILENVGRVVPNDSVNIALVENNFVRFTHWRGYTEEMNEFMRHTLIPLETPNFHQMFITGQPLLIRDTEDPAHAWHWWDAASWVRSYAAAPIKTHGQVIGFLNLDSSQPGFFTEADTASLAALADQAAVAIENAQLYNEIRLHAASLEQRVEMRTAQLESERAQLQATLDAMGEGVVYAEDHDVRYVNHALSHLIGYSLEEFIPRMPMLLGEDLARAGHDPAQFMTGVLAVLIQEGIWRGELRITRKNGSAFDASLTVTLVSPPHTTPVCTVTLIRDISQEKALQAQKDRFIANASHELRTPITNMKMRLYLLRKQRDRFENHMEILDMVSDRMQRLVESLLDVSRFERGVIEVQRQPVTLQDLVDNVLTVQQPQADAQDIALDWQYPDDPIIANVDPGLITQVITNLITNAINYTEAGGQVTVELSLDPPNAPTEALLRVRDSGIGIPAEALDQIFEPFYRVNEQAARGTGLGLTISREIVNLHQGQLTVESQAGEGSTFTVRLPLSGPD